MLIIKTNLVLHQMIIANVWLLVKHKAIIEINGWFIIIAY
jgi:hypothetical protein